MAAVWRCASRRGTRWCAVADALATPGTIATSSVASSAAPPGSAAAAPAALAALWQQRRWWYDPDARRGAYDKPAYTGSKYAFVRSHIPVVLLDHVRGVGKKGQIVNVKRGYARHQLVPKGLAVFGTWQNIDSYADPALVEDPTLKARVESGRGRLPFDWVDDIRLRFVRWAREDELQSLLEPITVWDVLEALSDHHELDLLPGNVELPEGGLERVGLHDVPVRIAFRSPESAAGRYTIRVDAVSQQSQQDELRREEMAKAVAESVRFQLPQRGAAGGGAAGEDQGTLDEEDEEEAAAT